MAIWIFAKDNRVYNPVVDPNTVLLLHCDEDPFVDAMGVHTITNNDSVIRDASESKFGGYSAYFNGANYLSAADSDDWHLTGDFTIAFWTNFGNSIPTANVSWITQYQRVSGGRSWAVLFRQNRITFVYSFDGSTAPSLYFNWTPSINTWYHVALTRSGSSVRAFVDGIQVGTTVSVGGALRQTSSILRIGRFTNDTTEYFTGWMDEIYLVNGTALWTSNFTPPPLPYVIS